MFSPWLFLVIAPSSQCLAIALPAHTAPISIDYIAYDTAASRLWVPTGSSGSVEVVNDNGKIDRVQGFATIEREAHGQKRTVGPSSVTIGDGVAYVGNRADNSVCAIDAKSLARGVCVKLDLMPDGLAYIAATKEVWVTTPAGKSLTVIDTTTAAQAKAKTTIALSGEPEGYALNEKAGLFYTNLEDADRTLAIDFKTKKVVATYDPACGEKGPRGVAADQHGRFLFVACSDRVVVLDLSKKGAVIARVETGAGVDNIAFLQSQRLLFVAAGKDARLTVAHIAENGEATIVSKVDTASGSRVVVVDASGNAYVPDAIGGRILKFPGAGK